MLWKCITNPITIPQTNELREFAEAEPSSKSVVILGLFLPDSVNDGVQTPF